MEILLVSCTDIVTINDIFGCFCTEMMGNFYPLFEIRMHIFGANNKLGYSLH